MALEAMPRAGPVPHPSGLSTAHVQLSDAAGAPAGSSHDTRAPWLTTSQSWPAHPAT
jgi:hypothetical protein